MSKIQSFVLDDPSNTIFRTGDPNDTRVLLSLTMYDMRILAQIVALAAFPENFRGVPGYSVMQAVATRVGNVMLHFLDEVWDNLSAEEQNLGMNHTIYYPGDAPNVAD